MLREVVVFCLYWVWDLVDIGFLLLAANDTASPLRSNF